MISLKVSLKTVRDVQDFVHICTRFDTVDIDVVSGRFIIDAKSIMGLFSLDLSKPLTVNIHADSADDIKAALDRFLVQQFPIGLTFGVVVGSNPAQSFPVFYECCDYFRDFNTIVYRLMFAMVFALRQSY